MALVDKFFQYMVDNDVSDLHLSSGEKPMVRQHGELTPLGDKALTNDKLRTILYEILTDTQIKYFEDTHDLDFAYELPGVARFRANYFMQQRGIGGVFRTIPSRVLTMEELGLPPVVREFAGLPRGLVLVTGPTGSGKSTTLASILDHVNAMRKCHILTIEDPVEFVHESKLSLVSHREVGTHTNSFASALRAALREDPDVILLGEMRDLETMELAITAAETGHLVLGTLHTSSAPKTVDRVIDVFPSGQQNQIRSMLSESLKGVISQQLLRRADKQGRVAAYGVLVVTSAVANLIREGKTFQIPSIMQTGKQLGMRLLDGEIMALYNDGVVSAEEAYAKSSDKKTFETLLGDKAPNSTVNSEAEI